MADPTQPEPQKIDPTQPGSKICGTHFHLSKEGFGAVLTQAPSPPWAWGLKLKDTFLKTVYETKDVQQFAN